ncbi:uncharacterized protein [Diadema setosum]|uniref:uncharacterized protein n=1 Tax=Diadema setosum TaxID=31175 RepID=UPI003B3A2B2D
MKMTVNALHACNSTTGHSGLQALQVIGSSVRSFLGPAKSIKCVLDGDRNEGNLISTTNELLQTLDIEHPVGQLVRETCLSQYKVHGSGCSTLVTLVGLWAGQVQILLDKGVPIDEIIKYGDVFIAECLKIADKNAIPLHFSSRQPNAEFFRKSRRTTHTSFTHSVGRSEHLIQRKVGGEEGTSNFSVPRRQCDVNFNPGNPNYNSNNCNPDHLSNSMALNAINAPEGDPSGWREAPVTLHSSRDDDAVEKSIDEDLSWFFETGDDDNSHREKSLSGGYQHSQEDELLCIKAQGSSNSSTTRHEGDDVDGMQSKCKEHAGRAQSSSVVAAATNPSRMQSSGESGTELHHTTDKDLSGVAPLSLKPRQGHKEPNQEGVTVNFLSRDGNPGLPVLGGDDTCAAGNYGSSTDKGECLHDGKPGCVSVNGLATSQSGTASGKPKSQLQQLSAMLHEVHSIAKRPTRDSCISSLHSSPAAGRVVNENTKSSHVVTSDMDGVFLSLGTKMPSLSKPQDSPKVPASRSHGRILSRHLLANDNSSSSVTSKQVMAERRLGAQSLHKLQTGGGGGVKGRRTDHDMDGRLGSMGSMEKVGQSGVSSLEELSYGLSHGAEVEMKLALEVYHKQLSVDPQFFRGEFDGDRVHIQTLVGPPSSASGIVEGLILPLCEDQIQNLQSLTGKNLQALLVNGDISATYRHRGFKKSLKTTTVSTNAHLRNDSKELLWAENIFSCLDKLGVDVLIVRGSVDALFLDDGRLQQRLVLHHVPYTVLQMLAAVCKSTVLTYVTDALQDDVCRSLKVSYWMPGYNGRQIWRSSDPGIKHHIKLTTLGGMMTAVVCGPSEPLLIGVKERFTACMARLRGALHDGKVLPGRGDVEEIIAGHFCGEDTRSEFHSSQPLVCSILSEGLSQFTAQIRINQGLQPGTCSPAHQQDDSDVEKLGEASEHPVYDCMAAKTGAWKRSWHLLGRVLWSDALIITGVGKGDRHLAAEL